MKVTPKAVMSGTNNISQRDAMLQAMTRAYKNTQTFGMPVANKAPIK